MSRVEAGETKTLHSITIPAGTMLNRGLHEDDDFFVADKNLTVLVIGACPGALRVVIPETGEALYYHQPEPSEGAGRG
ncbi:MAG: hypothetical protein ACOY0S_01005 [Patescibacteria group bacterium]